MILGSKRFRLSWLLPVIVLTLPAGNQATTISYPPGPDSAQVSAARELEEIQSHKIEVGGRYRGFRTHKFDSGLTGEQRELLEQLESIGYVGGSREAPLLKNVTIHEKDRVYSGLNFFTSGHGPTAILMDMDGRVLHQWSYPFEDVWPDYPLGEEHPGTEFWRRAYLFDNGDILAVYEGLGIIKLDKDSNLIWANANHAHHDLEVLPNGDIYVLTREARVIPHIDRARPVLEDFISILDAQGNEKRRISVLQCFENSGSFDGIYRARPNRVGDIFHTNTLVVLDGRIADKAPAFRAGDVLTSMRALSAIAVIDMDEEKVVWAKRGNFRRQHDPKILENGHLLLFDNDRKGTRQSGVQEYDPVTMKILWEYRGTAEEPFYTRSGGAAQRLPNGNTLMTESDNGRAIEVTPQKEIVWEFYNPYRAGVNAEFIASVLEMIRLDPAFPVHWAGNPKN